MIHRLAIERARILAQGFPVVVVTGPRQSGKTTLARAAFPDFECVSLEDPDVRWQVASDPRGFLARHANGVVIDEVQRLPELLSYLQTAADASAKMGRFILTGSQNLMLSAAITQSLAGRAGLLELLPLSWAEIAQHSKALQPSGLNEWLLKGGYPALYDRPVAARDWMSSYVGTYIERDVRQVSRINDLLAFQRFMRMMAARAGQLLNLNAVAQDLGVAQTTARDWLDVLEATYVVCRLPPYHTNFGKRLVKTPKLYFHDTGLACWLQGITSTVQLDSHPMRGALFENMLMIEYRKYCRHLGLAREMYFWRDHIGNEVDLLIEQAGELWPVEMKSGATFQPEWRRGLETWIRHAALARRGQPMLISSAPTAGMHQGVMLACWRDALQELGRAPGQS